MTTSPPLAHVASRIGSFLSFIQHRPGQVPATSSKLHAVASLVVPGFLGQEQAEPVMAEYRRRFADAVTC
jgi:hypothetical protein